MPEHVVQRVAWVLNEDGIAVSTADVLVVGVAYKPNVSDTRESPAADIIQHLEERGASVAYHDPFVDSYAVNGTEYHSCELSRDAIERADCVVLVTDHDAIDYGLLADAANVVFDTRGRMDRSIEAVNPL